MKLINIEAALSDVRTQGYSIIPEFLSRQELEEARSEYFNSINECPPHPQGEKFRPIDLENRPWRKHAIGSKSGSGEPYSQLLQTTYFAQQNQDYPMLSKVFTEMIKIRNSMTEMRLDYGSDLVNDDFWNACRVHHYPRGGGHMASHKDTLFPRLLSNFEFPFIQIMTTLTNRNSDFKDGGGYIVNKEGKTIFFENEVNAGALVLFDGETVHGVEDVDPNQLLDMDSNLGRIALFVNLYANLQKEK
jgi:hypothetical protein